MAVKRVILQQFSMQLNYLNKERSNIYQPSVKSPESNQLVDQDRSERDECNSSSTNSPVSPPTDEEGQSFGPKARTSSVRVVNNQHCDIFENTKNILTSALDNLAELNDKLPETSDKRVSIKPEENWRYRSGTDNKYYPFNYKNQGRNNVHFEGPAKFGKKRPAHNHHFQPNVGYFCGAGIVKRMNGGGIEIRKGIRSCSTQVRFGGQEYENWRNECTLAPSSSSSSSPDNVIGLSPPNESLLMKRRLSSRQSLSTAKYYEGNPINSSINTIKSASLKLQPMTCSS